MLNSGRNENQSMIISSENTASGFNWSSSLRSQMQITLMDACCLELKFIHSTKFDNLQDNYTRIIDTE